VVHGAGRAGMNWYHQPQPGQDRQEAASPSPSPISDHHGQNWPRTAPPAMQPQLIPERAVFGSKATPALLFDYTLCIIPIVKP